MLVFSPLLNDDGKHSSGAHFGKQRNQSTADRFYHCYGSEMFSMTPTQVLNHMSHSSHYH